MKTKLALLIASVSLTGCTTTNPPQVENWKKYGFEQAIAGNILKTQEMNDTEDYDQYLIGYKVGQQVYCAQDPYRLGMLGKVYQGICDEFSEDFRAKHELGRIEYLAVRVKMLE